MSTRSTIAYQDASGIHAIYCHWDGYPQHNGDLLLHHYTLPERIKELIALGDISVLQPRLRPLGCQKHSFEAPVPNVTVAYHRDRNEPWDIVKPRTYQTVDEFLRTEGGNDYYYLWKNGMWLMARGWSGDFRELTEEDCE